MSGPKTSSYRMTPEQLKRLQEELERRRQEQIRKEKLRREKKKLSEELAELKRLVSEAESFSDELLGTDEDTKDVIKRIEKLLNSEQIEDIQKGIQLIRSKRENIHDKILNHVRQEKASQLKKVYERNQILAAGFDVSFDSIGTDDGNEKSKYEDLIFEKLKGISFEHLSVDLQKQWRWLTQKAQTITDAGFLESFYNISVLPFVKECQRYCDGYAEYGNRYEELLLEYKALLLDIGGEEKEIPFSIDNVQVLEELVHQMKQQLLAASEEEYISKSIDEAMEEMGYELVGHREIVKKSGKKYRHELYHFSEGTAVNVTYANNGQITMELGAVDDHDRVPTDREAEKLTEDMTRFCGEYAALEKILAKKGIVRKNIQILPPSVDYAQIINTSEYEMTEELDSIRIQRSHRNKGMEKYMQ